MTERAAEQCTVQNFIGGEWKDGAAERSANSINPATGETVGKVIYSTTDDVEEAVQSAHRAYPSWRKMTATQRGAYLEKMAILLHDNRSSIAELITREMGKIYAEALGEVDAAIASCKYMAGEARRMFGLTAPSMLQDRTVSIVREPMGVVACISPWNFPVSLASYKIFAALISGNTVVWKPATEVAVSARYFMDVLNQSGLPTGVLNFVVGPGGVVGTSLASHPLVRVVAFTGSTEVGLSLAETASWTLKRVSLELGGKNAVIVLADADLDAAASAVVKSAFATTGQRCTAASRLIVEASVHDELLERVVRVTEELRVGYGIDDGVDVGPLASDQQLKNVEAYVEIAKTEGAKVLCGGRRVEVENHRSGYFYAPTVLTGVQRNHRIAREEVFGPVLSVIRVQNLDEAIAVNNDTEYGLSSAIFTKSLRAAQLASGQIESGLVMINNGTVTSETGMPFGGYKLSGNGHREVSHHAFDAMTEWKTIYTSY